MLIAADTPDAFASRQPRLWFRCFEAPLGFHQFPSCSARRREHGVYMDWTWKRQLAPRGGRYFFHRVELAVPSFRQWDEKWRDDPLGGVEENGTLGGEGCAVAAAAMVFKFYGVDPDPQQLNWFFPSVDGYTENGWIYWDRAAWLKHRPRPARLRRFGLVSANRFQPRPRKPCHRASAAAERRNAFCRHRRQRWVRLPGSRSRRRFCERPLSIA